MFSAHLLSVFIKRIEFMTMLNAILQNILSSPEVTYSKTYIRLPGFTVRVLPFCGAPVSLAE